MLRDGPRCPNCHSVVALDSLFRAVGTDRLGCLRQPAGLICPTCDAKLRVKQPKIVIVNLVVFMFLGSVAATIGVVQRRSGNETRGAIELGLTLLFVGIFELLRRWYTPRLASFEVVPSAHALYLPLGERI
jgi:hypothetical protein